MSRRPRVLVFNQYYWPGVEATAHILSHLCEELADDFDVTVVTGCLRETAERPEHIVHRGVEIIRVPSTSFDRAPILARGVNYLTFLASSMWSGMRAAHPDVVLCMTDPPLVANIALPVARRFGVPLVVVTQDVFPEVAVQVGRLEHPVLVGMLRGLIGLSLRRADAVVAIGETMRERLEVKGVPPERIAVIPNWADTDAVVPMARDNDWAGAHGLEGKFVVMHSGNVGYAQDLETLVRASTFMRDLDDLCVAVIGDGARRDALRALARRASADSVRFFPYQPASIVSKSLSSADIHFVGLARGLSGYVVPSRLYGVMAVGRPVIASADADSDTARLVREVGCGVVVPPGRPDLVAREIRVARAGGYDLDAMGALGLEYVRGEASQDVAFGSYRRLLVDLAGRS